jgi:hypothetical protein
MEKQVKIYDYSCYDTHTVSDKGDNWSRVVSKMIQLAGRYCERFASDITYDANSFIKAIEEHQDYDRYLFFRENGVTALKHEDLVAIESTDYIQAWHLTYNTETEEQSFKRVSVTLERRYW